MTDENKADNNSISEDMTSSDLPSIDIKELPKTHSLYTSGIMESIVKAAQVGTKVMQSMGPALNGAFINYTSMLRNIFMVIDPILEQLREIASSILKSVKSIRIPYLSEEEKEKLLENHRQWGRFGWTWFHDIPYGFYDTPPGSYSEANEKLNRYAHHNT